MLLLRSVLRANLSCAACLTRCRHCRIFFLTHPCNVKHCDKLRCPFGCREAHRRQEAIRRSTAYYRDEEGKKRKKNINQRRCRRRPGDYIAAASG